MSRSYRLAILASHPVQYDAPFFRLLAHHPPIKLQVFYCSRKGSESYFDPEFGTWVVWDVPLLTGYPHDFLPNRSPFPERAGFLAFANPAILRRLRRDRYDAVLVHGWGHVSAWLAFGGARITKTPILLYGDSTLLTPRPWWLRKIKRVILGMLFRRVAGFLACGTFNAEFYAFYGAPGSRIFLTPYAIDNDFFLHRRAELLPQRASLREQLGLPAEMPAILFVGKLVPRKRPADLVQAYAGLRAQGALASLVLVGEGPLRATLEARVKADKIPDVHFLGFRNQKEMPAVYVACDLLALPSEVEPRGLVVNEAMACGLPVIVSDRVGVYGLGDILRPGETGFVFPVGDSSALRERLAELIRDPGLRQRMGAQARQVIAGWNYEARAAGIVAALDAIVGEEKPDAR